MSLHIVSETPAIDVAWEAFDREAIELERMYREGVCLSRRRQEQALKVAKLWGEFMALASAADDPRPAA